MRISSIIEHIQLHSLSRIERLHHTFKAPNAYLWWQLFIDASHHVRLSRHLSDHLERYQIASSMYACIGTRSTAEINLCDVVRVVLRYRTGLDESIK